MTVVLHIAPHPDDESIGAPGTLLRLADSGARVVVVACGLGRPVDRARRGQELHNAMQVAGHELVIRDPPTDLTAADDLVAAHAQLVPWLVSLLDYYRADLVIAPHLRDAHHAHQTVASAVRDAIPLARRPPVWWAWAIWADLHHPTLMVPIDEARVERAVAALSCYHGELARNDYVDLMLGAGRVSAVRGVERVMGFGAAGLPGVRHAELLAEFGWVEGGWRAGVPRVDDLPSLPQAWRSDDGGEITGYAIPAGTAEGGKSA